MQYHSRRKSLRAATAAVLALVATPALAVDIVDLSEPNATATVNGTIFTQATVSAAGSGNINAFLRVQGAASGDTETGYNTDARPLQFDEKTDPIHTRSLRLDEVPTVVKNGVTYRQFILDNNEPAAASKTLISLDTFMVFLTAIPNVTGVSLATPAAVLGNLVYNLDAGADRSLLFDANLAQGSGKYDATIEIPDANFTGPNTYVTVLATFGITARAQAGFEEFGVGPITNPNPVGGGTGTGGTGSSGTGTGAGGLVITPTSPASPVIPLPAAAHMGLSTLALIAACSAFHARRTRAAR
jgi:hypothetical protein